MNMNEHELEGIEQLADHVVSLADSWMRNPLAYLSSIEDDTEFQRLEEARDEVKRRKFSILRQLDPEERWHLTRRHAVWINEYDLNIVLIDKAEPSSVFRGNHIGLECVLSSDHMDALRTFYWCGGIILRVETKWVYLMQRTHAEDPTIWEVLKFREMLEEGISISGEFTRRDAIYDGEHTWLFVGNRWENADNILKLDFGHHINERDYFLKILEKQQSENQE